MNGKISAILTVGGGFCLNIPLLVDLGQDSGAAALQGTDHAFILQHLERMAHRISADAEGRHKAGLGGQQTSFAVAIQDDVVAESVINLHIFMGGVFLFHSADPH